MLSAALPAELKAALTERLHGFSRSKAASRAQAISQTYRSGGDSSAIRCADDALSYALTRMPATYAAVTACLNVLAELLPTLAPHSLLDIGAGPGTASFAAAQAFPALHVFTLIDANPALRQLALELTKASPRLGGCDYRQGDAGTVLNSCPSADVVIASYSIGEVTAAERPALITQMWAKTAEVLIVIEPGTTQGQAHILALSQQLVAAGAYIAAPCPHQGPCPLAAPDWCHFSQRLPRLKAHRQIKQAELPFEDEKFSYVILTRPSLTPAQVMARVVAPPVLAKAAITARLCTTTGVNPATVARRDAKAYAAARRWRWGTALWNEI